ncbi:hypothetical protein F2Q69_00051486 [Brassica cretica]|uniref:Uncharacterized protein n=1 Tax=Brassica cretica TaxID=69181 RepID=A0A8S9PVM3_BRACR|nr:hypothetical protein F2Q69_00051486 [Brassica cretica]
MTSYVGGSLLHHSCVNSLIDVRHQMSKKGSTLPYLNTSISWGGMISTEPLSLKVVDARPEHMHATKQISFQDQDSPSTQSTCQSYTEVASSGDDEHDYWEVLRVEFLAEYKNLSLNFN